ncbi:hypothetical protein Tco_0796399 [Tanacetum coccineum]
MTTLAEFMIIAGADNRPPMLEKSMYDSWKSRMELYMENRENRRMILNSVQNGPLVWQLLLKKIVPLGKRSLPPDVYAIVNHHKVVKEIWDRVKLLMQGTELSLQERECKLYDEFDKFSFVKGHIASQCTQPKRPRNAAWFKEKAMLAEAQESGQILDEEQLAFLTDPGSLDGQTAQTTILNNAAFRTEDLDAYDSDCDDVKNAKAVLMANLSIYGSDVISEYLQETQQAAIQDTHLYTQQDSMILSVIEQIPEQMLNHVNNWQKANQEKNNESLTVELERYKERVKTFEQRLNIDLSSHEKMIDSQMDDMIKEKLALKQQIDSLEQNLSNQIKERNHYLLGLDIPRSGESLLNVPQFAGDNRNVYTMSDEGLFWGYCFLEISSLSKPSPFVIVIVVMVAVVGSGEANQGVVIPAILILSNQS